jgi:ABC-2 type transport system ATP-binding protein
VIELDSVTVGDAPRRLDRVSFSVGAGQLVALHGEPGAGKTLTLAAMLGLVPTVSGSATLLGLPYRELDRPGERVGTVLHPAPGHRRLTARAWIARRAAVLGRGADDVERVVGTTGLGPAADARLRALAAPQRWRAALAAALLGAPQVLVLDGPLEHLGDEDLDGVVAVLGALAVEGASVLVATRRLEPLRAVLQDVVLLRGGRVVSRLPSSRLARADDADGVLVRTPSPVALERGLRRQRLDVARDGDELLVRSASAPVVAEVARAVDAPVHALRDVDGDLDRAAARITGADDRRPEPSSEPAADPRAGELLRELDAELEGRVLGAGAPRWILVRGAAPGVGTSTVAALLADLAVRLGGRGAIVVTPSAAAVADPVRRSVLGLEEVLRDLPGLDEHARLRPYLSRLETGVDVLAGDPAALSRRAAQAFGGIAEVPGAQDATIVLDLGSGAVPPGLVLDGEVRTVLVAADDEGEEPPVAPAGTLVVVNRAPSDARARFAALLGASGDALLPDEPRLPAALLESGDPTAEAGALARVAVRSLWAAVVAPAEVPA